MMCPEAIIWISSFRRGLVLALLALAPLPVMAGELSILVTGLRSTDGTVHVALYDAPGHWPDKGAELKGKVVPAGPKGALARFTDLAPGRYAIAAYHDENANGEFDQNCLGFPLEGFGFGNDAAVVLSAPDFEEAAVSVGEAPTRTTLRMRYW